jgi:uncharacterized membrane protein
MLLRCGYWRLGRLAQESVDGAKRSEIPAAAAVKHKRAHGTKVQVQVQVQSTGASISKVVLLLFNTTRSRHSELPWLSKHSIP